jgi:hypothetical protein
MYFCIILFYFTKSKESGIYPSSDWFKYHIHLSPGFVLPVTNGIAFPEAAVTTLTMSFL